MFAFAKYELLSYKEKWLLCVSKTWIKGPTSNVSSLFTDISLCFGYDLMIYLALLNGFYVFLRLR